MAFWIGGAATGLLRFARNDVIFFVWIAVSSVEYLRRTDTNPVAGLLSRSDTVAEAARAGSQTSLSVGGPAVFR